MQRIPTVDLQNPPADAKEILDGIQAKFGKVPNIFASVANNPSALKALMGMFGALDGGELSGIPHEAIALLVGQTNGCKYCTAAHTAKAKMAGASEEDTIGYRKGEGTDQKIQGLLNLAKAIVEKNGRVNDVDVDVARSAGLSDSEMIETVAIVVLNLFTNYINALVQTELDFPAAPAID